MLDHKLFVIHILRVIDVVTYYTKKIAYRFSNIFNVPHILLYLWSNRPPTAKSVSGNFPFSKNYVVNVSFLTYRWCRYNRISIKFSIQILCAKIYKSRSLYAGRYKVCLTVWACFILGFSVDFQFSCCFQIVWRIFLFCLRFRFAHRVWCWIWMESWIEDFSLLQRTTEKIWSWFSAIYSQQCDLESHTVSFKKCVRVYRIKSEKIC